jgi:hypothetical protein
LPFDGIGGRFAEFDDYLIWDVLVCTSLVRRLIDGSTAVPITQTNGSIYPRLNRRILAGRQPIYSQNHRT